MSHPPRMTAAISLPDPEIRPAADEQRPVIGPNLAKDQALAKAVTQYVVTQFQYPQLLMQQPFWSTWRKIDNMWRAKVATQDLTVPNVTAKSLETLTPSATDGKSARAQSIKPFQQMHGIINIGEQISWEDGIPARAIVPEEVVEGDFYQPTQQSCVAVNSILRRTATDIDLRSSHRRGFGCFVKYGVSWAMTDFSMKYEQVELHYPIDADPNLAEAQMQAIAGQHQNVQFGPGLAVAKEWRVAEMKTSFMPLAAEDVFIDPLIPCDPIERQPCPIIRQHITEAELEGHRYDAQTNPFGFVNIELAVSENKGHYALSQDDETPLLEKLKNRYGISDQITGDRRQRIRQRWTTYPLLRIGGNNQLDTGDGITCPHCEGKKWMFTEQGETECPTCKATGKVAPELKRYVAEFYGAIKSGATCIRIQEMPKGMDIPLLYAADLIEDDSCAIPLSKSEVAMTAAEQLTTAETQFHDSKEKVIYRGTLVKMDSPAAKIQNFNAPNLKVLFENDPREVDRMDAGQYDETTTLLPQIQRKEDQIEQIYGLTPTLQGMLASGRRSALEVGEATEAAKNPLVLMVDRYNRKHMGGWARKSIKNMELFGDRDYIRRITGKEFFGKVDIFTAVGEEFFKKMAALANVRYILESSANDPAMQPIRPQLWNASLKLMGITNITVPDGGLQLAKDQASEVVSQILGDGQFLPPMPDDPHEIYVEVFRAALRNKMWQRMCPQNMPLLMQRMQMQEVLLQQQMMEQMAAQIAQQQMMNPQEGEGGKGNKPKTPGKSPKDGGEQMQHAQQ